MYIDSAGSSDKKGERRSGGVEAAEVVGSILSGMIALRPPCRLKDLESCTGIAAAKLHRYLVSMIASGLVRKADDGSRYQFGLLAYGLAAAVQHATDFVSTLSPLASALADELGESVGVALWTSDAATVVRWFQGSNDLSIALRPNARLGLTTSTTGRLFGAYLPRELIEPLVAAELASKPQDDLTLAGVFRQFAEIRKTGVSIGLGNRVPGINSLSAPVFDRDGQVAACITILGPESRLDASPDGKHYRAVTSACERFSSQLGAQAEHHRTAAS